MASAVTELESVLQKELEGEVRFDSHTRHLFSTDASLYAIEPVGVVFPRHADDVVATVSTAVQFGVPVLPRGGGTSLAGQTVGRAVVMDFSRHMHHLVALEPQTRTARVQPGLVQDELNLAAQPLGLFFAPDTSTSNRATLGGMIGNNSCGARSARYGMTIDHVEALDVVLCDASRARFQAMPPDEAARRARATGVEGRLYRELPALVSAHERAIREDFPPYWRRSGGYRLERLLPDAGPMNLSRIVVGSEGTLAVVVEAEVKLVPHPRAVSGVAGHFHSVADAVAAVEAARECDAAAIELVDRFILDLARRSPSHAHLVSVLEGEPGALLWTEFYGDTPAEAEACADLLVRRWSATRHGYAVTRASSPAQLKAFRELRKAGLGLLTAAGQGRERSIAFVEDTAVDPARLSEYTARFAAILDRHQLRAGFYGHASAGCLHIRPFMDLARPGEVARMRAVAEEVSELVVAFGGMNSSEHGDGLVRGEFSRRHFGDELYGAMREVKRIFDPDGRLNPGKKVDTPLMTENLRDPALPEAVPLTTAFRFDHSDGWRGAANRCARIGACRKGPDSGGTMCPSFMATRDEQHSTRGRANALVRVLSLADPRAALGEPDLHEALDLCVGCKACKRECPLSVDMAAMKAEALSHYHRVHGVPLRTRLFGNARTVNRLGAALAPVSNWVAGARAGSGLRERLTGIDRRRALPRFRRETLSRWFARRMPVPQAAKSRGPVVFLADSFTSYSEPEIGISAIELLERAGYEVRLESDVCCGRSLISNGMLDEARTQHARLIGRLAPIAARGVPIAGCEPSCVFTLRDELVSLSGDMAGADAVARQAVLVDDLLAEALDDGTLAVPHESTGAAHPVLLHMHCHQKAAGATGGSAALLRHLPGAKVTVLDAGCCGMAGSFGFEREHYDLSMQIGGMRLFPAVRQSAPETLIAATGVSCRQQIAHGTGRPAAHPVVLLHQSIIGP
ncbi:MAG TPA: FAD-linked oxidase C-terminal domain-containing protein [Gemmatimonadaceae bacterium]